FDGTTILDLGTLGGSESNGLGINDAGRIVGYSLTAGDTSTHAFLYDGVAMHDLNNLIAAGSVTLQVAFGINNVGQIVAYGRDSSTSRDGAYLLTPPGPLTISNVSASPSFVMWSPNHELVN